VYTEKIDCFSFGVIIVQIFTRQFPKPGDRLQEVEFNHPGLPAGTLCVRVSEVNRRQNHISEIPPDNSLLLIAFDCLKDKDSERPLAHQLCERVADLKGKSDYRDSARAFQDKDEVIRQQRQQIQEKDQTISIIRQQLEEGERQIGLLNQQLRQLQLENDQNARQKEEKEKQLGRVNQQLEASEQVVAQFERRITELEQQLSQREQQKTKASSRGKELTSFKLRWRKGKRAPCEMYRYYDTAVDGNTVYVINNNTVNIYSYNITSDSWSQLPDCVHKNASIAVISGCLTTVGGGSYPIYSNELLSLTGEGSGRRWTQQFPPMPTKRRLTTSLCTGATLIVAGGKGVGGRELSTVEVMGTETHQWSTAADLPQPMYRASATVCGDQLYMLGGDDSQYTFTKSVYTCSVSALLQCCVPSSLEANFQRTSLEDKARVWRPVADLPVTRSTCESFRGQLLAVGGWMDSSEFTTAVYMYNSITNSWEIISHMTTGRCHCFTAVLPDKRLMVMGGFIGYGITTDSVGLATSCER
jgi:hypothetical protein